MQDANTLQKCSFWAVVATARNQTLYPAALRELHRVADPWHGRCVLLSSEVNAVLLRQSAEAAGWKMQESGLGTGKFGDDRRGFWMSRFFTPYHEV